MSTSSSTPARPTQFLAKTYALVGDPAVPGIEWTAHGDAFVVTDAPALARHFPNLFKHASFPSFTRQLNIYGFTKRSHPHEHAWTFTHPLFRRGRPELLVEIRRQGSADVRAKNRIADAEARAVEAQAEREQLVAENARLRAEMAALRKELETSRTDQERTHEELQSIIGMLGQINVQQETPQQAVTQPVVTQQAVTQDAVGPQEMMEMPSFGGFEASSFGPFDEVDSSWALQPTEFSMPAIEAAPAFVEAPQPTAPVAPAVFDPQAPETQQAAFAVATAATLQMLQQQMEQARQQAQDEHMNQPLAHQVATTLAAIAALQQQHKQGHVMAL